MGVFAIDELPLGAGRIGMCPLPIAASDREAVRVWQPEMIVTLTPRSELIALAGEGLEAFFAGYDWRGFPIEDYGVPGPTEIKEWPKLSSDILGVLDRASRVLVHCRGGCGRTGMMVLRLMVEAGEPADVALRRLRATRPCAIETDAQMRWAIVGAAGDKVRG